MTTPPDSTKKTPSVARLEKMLPVLRERFGVIKIGIFGSTARGEERFDSDVDILVELSPEHLTFRNFTALADFLEEVYGRRGARSAYPAGCGERGDLVSTTPSDRPGLATGIDWDHKVAI